MIMNGKERGERFDEEVQGPVWEGSRVKYQQIKGGLGMWVVRRVVVGVGAKWHCRASGEAREWFWLRRSHRMFKALF